jgi:hypothetical protein
MNVKILTATALAAIFSTGAWAQVTVTASQTDNALIPDYNTANLNTVSESIHLSGTGIQSITGVSVTLDVGAGDGGVPFNSDYYAYLLDPSGSTAVLLNRVGIGNAANPLDIGYGDAGFDITLSDGGYDIHNYQNTSYNLNGDGQLTGNWAPDGRNDSPFTVEASDARTAPLDGFDGSGANGTWTLVIADASQGDYGVLEGWGLEVTGTAATSSSVPDGGSAWATPFLGGLGLLMFARLTNRPRWLGQRCG